jgi:hypothetical protein
MYTPYIGEKNTFFFISSHDVADVRVLDTTCGPISALVVVEKTPVFVVIERRLAT